MSKPLEGVKIVDLSNMLMAPYATQILADLGADIIKVESPEGDPIRGFGPHRQRGMGAMFLNVNRSKRSILLDLKQPLGKSVALDLIKNASVLIYNRRPKGMERLGLSYEEVSTVNPGIIYVGLFGYDEDGSYANKPAFDDLIQGGVSTSRLTPEFVEQGPTYTPTAIVDRSVALWAVGQITAALFHHSKTGEGQRINIPVFEMMASFVLADHLAGHTFDPPLGPPGNARMQSPDRWPYRTKDGYLSVMLYSDRHWRSFFEVLGQDRDFERDPRLANRSTRAEHIEAIYLELALLLETRTTYEWLVLFDDADIPAMPMHSLDRLLDDPHLNGADFFSIMDHPSDGRLRDHAVPGRWAEQPTASRRPAPQLGEHSFEVLREAGYTDDHIEVLVACGVTSAPIE